MLSSIITNIRIIYYNNAVVARIIECEYYLGVHRLTLARNGYDNTTFKLVSKTVLDILCGK